MSKMRRTWSSMSRCCAVTHTRLSMRSACFASSRMTGPSLTASGRVLKTVRTFNIAQHSNFGSNLSGSGALRPPPPVVAPLVPRCALLPAATPRDVLSAVGTRMTPRRLMPKRLTRRVDHYLGSEKVQTGRSPIMRGVGAGRSAQRGTSGATTGPRGARSAPPNPDRLSVTLMLVIGNIAQFWRLTRELDVNGLRESLERPVSLRVLGSDLSIAQRVARLIEPDPAASEVSAGVLGELSRERADLYIAAIGGPLESDARRVLSDLSVSETPLVLVQSEAAVGMLVVGI